MVKASNDSGEMINSLSELEDRISKIQSQISSSKIKPLLFRGQASSSWELETTLDREMFSSNYLIKIEDYRSFCEDLIPAIRSNFGKFDYLNIEEITIPIQERHMRTLEFMAYIRHLGVPSPLLDWTESPYIALYFAFRNRKLLEKEESVSLYIFQDDLGGGKSGVLQEPFIVNIGSSLGVHPRHHSQQSQYTLCMQKKDSELYFSKHGKVFQRRDEYQDVLQKINISTSLREELMKRLKMMNINEYTLFHSESALLKDLSEEYLFYRCNHIKDLSFR